MADSRARSSTKIRACTLSRTIRTRAPGHSARTQTIILPSFLPDLHTSASCDAARPTVPKPTHTCRRRTLHKDVVLTLICKASRTRSHFLFCLWCCCAKKKNAVRSTWFVAAAPSPWPVASPPPRPCLCHRLESCLSWPACWTTLATRAVPEVLQALSRVSSLECEDCMDVGTQGRRRLASAGLVSLTGTTSWDVCSRLELDVLCAMFDIFEHPCQWCLDVHVMGASTLVSLLANFVLVCHGSTAGQLTALRSAIPWSFGSSSC